ncbi:MAG: adenylosuccinate lyase [Bacteroidales bacterium]|nr:adenylosuccinate lyase [Bacteroidales bacterium]
MADESLKAISPIDGRYQSKTKILSTWFSEYALIQYRLRVEVEYFIALCRIPLPQLKDVDRELFPILRNIYLQFDETAALKIKEIESVTNHDVKAVEYYLREKFEELKLSKYQEFIHFGLTSQDINNTAMPVALLGSLNECIIPVYSSLRDKLYQLASDWKDIPMLARTHGQPASPTRLGKEFCVFAERLEKQISSLNNLPVSGKFGGATGNFNAHKVAYPEIDWVEFGNNFLQGVLNIHRQQTTTQIEHYDDLASIFDNVRRINTILIDFCRDIWTYISMDYFTQKVKANEVGSSAMPHKVNPIDFENAEGNLGIANAILGHLSEKLPISRLQRDLTDSTVTRNMGVPLAHSILACQSISKGIGKIILNEKKLQADLEANWAVVAEAIQTILRRENYPDPYNALKQLTRTGESINQQTIIVFINELDVNESIKEELRAIRPDNYTGIFDM